MGIALSQFFFNGDITSSLLAAVSVCVCDNFFGLMNLVLRDA